MESIKDKDAFLIDEPRNIVKAGKLNNVPLMIGVNQDEGLLLSSGKTYDFDCPIYLDYLTQTPINYATFFFS